MSYDYSENILVQKCVGNLLWNELPECYTENQIAEYRQSIYEYVYTRYRAVA